MTETPNHSDLPAPEEPAQKQEKSYWLDQPRNVQKVFWGLCTICALLALSGFTAASTSGEVAPGSRSSACSPPRPGTSPCATRSWRPLPFRFSG